MAHDEEGDPVDLGWDTEDRDERIASGELTEECEDPTEVLVGEDE